MNIRIGGMDIGKSEDYTALVVLDVDTARNLIKVPYAHRWPRRTKYFRIEEDMPKLQEQLQMHKLGIELNGPGSGVEEQIRLRCRDLKIIPITTNRQMTDPKKLKDVTKMSKPDMVKWKLRAKQKHIIKYPRNSKNPHIQELIKQNEIFKKHISDAGNPKYHAPGKQHDDLTMAELIGLRLAKEYIRIGTPFVVMGPAFGNEDLEMEMLAHV